VLASTAGKRPYDFYIVAGPEVFRAPFRTANHRTIDSDGEKTRGRINSTGGQKLTDRRNTDFFVYTIDLQLHD